MRSLIYWSFSLLVAVMAAGAADLDGPAETEGEEGPGMVAVMPAPPVPEPVRAALLGVGVMAIAYTYRRVWLNLRPQKQPQR